MFVPVVDSNKNPLMPTTPSRARRMIKVGEATPFFRKGIFCVRLNREPSDRKFQDVALGIDPGSKKEGYTVKSEAHTFLNITVDAKTDVKNKIESRRNARRARRFRKTPCRKNRLNRSRSKNHIPPSTKTRWDWKLTVINTLRQVFPVSHVIVEDICAKTLKGKRKWNLSFSPLEVGKMYFYDMIRNMQGIKLSLFKGYETYQLRNELCLKKSKKKLERSFNAHCVDSWTLCYSVVGGGKVPDNTQVMYISPIVLYRRQLHVFCFAKGGVRKNYGSTRSMGFKRGSLVKHKKHGYCYVGGSSKGKVSVHDLRTGNRISQYVKPEELILKSYSSWKTITI
jgi:hypothetical protein